MAFNHYVWQKLHEATYSLVSRGLLQNRLQHAYSELSLLKQHELPEEIQNDFKSVLISLTKKEAIGEEGTVRATLNQMTEDEAEDLSRKILSMYDNVTRYMKPH